MTPSSHGIEPPTIPGRFNCVDFVAPDTTVALNDFSYFTSHYNHGDPTGQGYGPMAPGASAGIVLLDMTEERPNVGERLLRVGIAVEGVEPFRAVVLAFRNAREALAFSSWTANTDFPGETLCTEVRRDGNRELFLGVLGRKDAPLPHAVLGEAVFKVLTDDDLDLTPDDFLVVVADVLTMDDNNLKMSSTSDRTFRPAVFDDALAQNYPNPFNPSTTVAFSLAQTVDVSLAIYDVTGRLVRTLVNESRPAGNHKVTWNGLDDLGSRVASGVYFYRMRAGSFVATNKMLLMK
jgi:hypothetical protein